METFIILCYICFWNSFSFIGPYAYGWYQTCRKIKQLFNLSKRFDEMHDSEYPLCLCKEHGRNNGDSSILYSFQEEARLCKCNNSQLYRVKKDNLRIVNLERYVIYVYDCVSSEYIYWINFHKNIVKSFTNS